MACSADRYRAPRWRSSSKGSNPEPHPASLALCCDLTIDTADEVASDAGIHAIQIQPKTEAEGVSLNFVLGCFVVSYGDAWCNLGDRRANLARQDEQDVMGL